MQTSEPVSTRKHSLDSRSVTYKRRPICWPAVLVANSGWSWCFPPSMVDDTFGHSPRTAHDTNRHRPSLPVCQVVRPCELDGRRERFLPLLLRLERVRGRDLCCARKAVLNSSRNILRMRLSSVDVLTAVIVSVAASMILSATSASLSMVISSVEARIICTLAGSRCKNSSRKN